MLWTPTVAIHLQKNGEHSVAHDFDHTYGL